MSNRLENELFPEQLEDFRYGEVPIGIKTAIQEEIGEEGAERMGKKVGTLVREMYHMLWKSYGTMIGDKKLTFADRLKSVYNMSVWQLAQRAPALKRAYRTRVREERARRAGEQNVEPQEVLENRGLDLHEIQLDLDMHVENVMDEAAPDD